MNTTDLLEQMLRGGAQATRSSAGSGAGGLGGLLGGLLDAAGGGAGRGPTGGLAGCSAGCWVATPAGRCAEAPASMARWPRWA